MSLATYIMTRKIGVGSIYPAMWKVVDLHLVLQSCTWVVHNIYKLRPNVKSQQLLQPNKIKVFETIAFSPFISRQDRQKPS